MKCPTCGRDYVNLNVHKCKATLDVEKLKLAWVIKVRIIALGESTNPNTPCGMWISGCRYPGGVPTKELEKNLGFSSLVMDGDLKVLNYTHLDTKPTEDYKKEIEYIITNWREFAEAKFSKTSSLPAYTSLDQVKCVICGSRHVPGISYDKTHMCVGCLLRSISWILNTKEQVTC